MYKNPWEYKKDVSTYERKHADIFLFFVQNNFVFVQIILKCLVDLRLMPYSARLSICAS